MIDQFEAGHYYKYIGPPELKYRQRYLLQNNIFLDGKPHLCERVVMGRSPSDDKEGWVVFEGMTSGAWPFLCGGITCEHWVEWKKNGQFELEF